MNNKIKFLQ